MLLDWTSRAKHQFGFIVRPAHPNGCTNFRKNPKIRTILSGQSEVIQATVTFFAPKRKSDFCSIG